MSNAGPDSSSAQPQASGGPAFPDTLWTVVRQASEMDDELASAALRKLCVLYREPIVARLRRQGRVNDAEDLANGFIEFLLEKNRLRNFVRTNAKFRSFLLTCLDGYLRDEWRKVTAQKRGSGEAAVPLDDIQVGQQESPATFDRTFALQVHARVLDQLSREQASKGGAGRFSDMQPYVLGVEGTLSYAELAARWGMSENNVTVTILRLRRRYADLFRAEVTQTVSSAEVDEEMRYLITLLADTEATAGGAPART